MSKHTTQLAEQYQTDTKFPSTFIEEQWKTNKRIAYIHYNYEKNLQLSFDADEVALCPFNGQQPDRLYLSLGKDSLGFVRFPKASNEAPVSGEYLQVDVADVYGGENGCATARLNFHFDRWYMNEERAPKAEKEVAAALTREGTRCWLAVRIRDGKAVAEELFVNDTALADWMKH
jgi:hypothetical protein